MKHLAIVFKDASLGSSKGREALDLALLSASYEQQVSLLFVADGVYQLLQQQQPDLLESKNYISTFKALPIYDVEEVLVCEQSLLQRAIDVSELLIDVEVSKLERIQGLLKQADQVVVF
ncbi:sulfurtransferase complex subunit TusC [Paraferrimonas sedimenticola]|uniref:Sulfurtransferase TusC n=1 Tax=Paraferrimonas sedimenticola TaxID=375674 RepID=A0AA37VVH4_9GAMM|nr:sulfurtransferase complex subunit TusC [Paraferrimonas sedimenticola]GLP96129.1 sulfurtransferase TusC [Paraferrimonas sedimenticola]